MLTQPSELSTAMQTKPDLGHNRHVVPGYRYSAEISFLCTFLGNVLPNDRVRLVTARSTNRQLRGLPAFFDVVV